MNKNKEIKEGDFKRKTGIKKETFNLILEILKEHKEKNKIKGGRPNKLSIEKRLLMTLEYLREYRTYFHIANNYGVDESTCYRNIIDIENILIKSQKFNLPKKKDLVLNENQIEVILVDATETPIERPKKNKENSIQEKRRNIQ
jgi:hypothetical protein